MQVGFCAGFCAARAVPVRCARVPVLGVTYIVLVTLLLFFEFVLCVLFSCLCNFACVVFLFLAFSHPSRFGFALSEKFESY